MTERFFAAEGASRGLLQPTGHAGYAYAVHPDLTLAYLRFGGALTMGGVAETFDMYTDDPRYRPGQSIIADFGPAESWERDYSRLMQEQARFAACFAGNPVQTLLVLHAPSEEFQAIARMLSGAWEGVVDVVARIASDEAGALALAGRREASFAELLAAVEPVAVAPRA